MVGQFLISLSKKHLELWQLSLWKQLRKYGYKWKIRGYSKWGRSVLAEERTDKNDSKSFEYFRPKSPKYQQMVEFWDPWDHPNNSCMYIFWNTMRVLHSQIPTAWPQLDSQNWNLCIKKCAKINLLTILKSHTFTSTTKNMGVAKVKKCFNL